MQKESEGIFNFTFCAVGFWILRLSHFMTHKDLTESRIFKAYLSTLSTVGAKFSFDGVGVGEKF
jgi:hypothetical protein